MSAADPSLFLSIGMAICALMAVVSLLRHKSRGVSAFIMSGAFVVLGLDMYLVRIQAPMPITIAGCVLLVVLLGADFAARAAHSAGKDSQR